MDCVHGVAESDTIEQLSLSLQFSWWLSGKRICLPIQKTWVRSLGQEDPLEEEILSSILARETPWTEEPGGL